MKQKIIALLLALVLTLGCGAMSLATEDTGADTAPADDASAEEGLAITVNGEALVSLSLSDFETVTATYASINSLGTAEEAEYTGVPVAAVMEKAAVEGEITGFEFIAADGYVVSLEAGFLAAAYLGELQPILVETEEDGLMLVVPQTAEDEVNKTSWATLLVSINVLVAVPVEAVPADTPDFASCVVSNQTLTVNGVEQSCTVYNIDGSNYFMLRDIAYMLKDTSAKFAIAYDAETRVITAVSGEDYVADGSEMKTGDDKSATCVPSNQAAVMNGAVSEAWVYNIGGNNFFQLRGLGEALGFDVDYDAETRTMLVTTAEIGDADSTDDAAGEDADAGEDTEAGEDADEDAGEEGDAA